MAAVARGALSYYRGVKGSRALATAPMGAPSPVAGAEGLALGEMLRVAVGRDLLGAARVRARFAAIPLDAFDRAAPLLAAEEQAAWFHLLLLSCGEGRNFCRAGKRDLMARLGLSERLCRARGREPSGPRLSAAASEVADLLAEGHGKERIEAGIRAVARKAGRAAPTPEVAP